MKTINDGSKNLCIIPARGGSKRIPRKNIRDFCGKPIIAYSIEAALNSGVCDEVMVSTDDEEIAEIAKKYGASVPFLRSAETSSDTATEVTVYREVAQRYKEMGYQFHNIIRVLATAPLLTGEMIREAYLQYEKEQCTNLQIVTQFSYPPQRGYWVENGERVYLDPSAFNARSQDLHPVYHDAGLCSIFSFRGTFGFSPREQKMGIYPIPESAVQDIDTPEDWDMAEFKYLFFQQKRKREQREAEFRKPQD